MADITETALPGVGQRIEFMSEAGNRIGVVHYRTGRRELFVCSPSDPDAVETTVVLTDDERHALADALGGSTIVERLEDMSQHVEGLAIDWLTVEQDSPLVGRTIGDARVRTRTGVSIVAVIRGDDAHPAPGPQFGMEGGDVLVVVGTPEGIAAVNELLATG